MRDRCIGITKYNRRDLRTSLSMQRARGAHGCSGGRPRDAPMGTRKAVVPLAKIADFRIFSSYFIRTYSHVSAKRARARFRSFADRKSTTFRSRVFVQSEDQERMCRLIRKRDEAFILALLPKSRS